MVDANVLDRRMFTKVNNVTIVLNDQIFTTGVTIIMIRIYVGTQQNTQITIETNMQRK